jgi:hypothetical protein
MSMQMFMIALKGGYTNEASREVQMFVRKCGGFILMATRTGPLVALENSRLPAVAKHPLVKFIGPVTLNPRGVAAQELQRIFAENLSKQLNVTMDADAPQPAQRRSMP